MAYEEKSLKNSLSKNLMEHVTLLALGRVKMEVLEHLNRHMDLLLIRMEAKYMRNRKKGLGLKIQIIKNSMRQTNYRNYSPGKV